MTENAWAPLSSPFAPPSSPTRTSSSGLPPGHRHLEESLQPPAQCGLGSDDQVAAGAGDRAFVLIVSGLFRRSRPATAFLAVGEPTGGQFGATKATPRAAGSASGADRVVGSRPIP